MFKLSLEEESELQVILKRRKQILELNVKYFVPINEFT